MTLRLHPDAKDKLKLLAEIYGLSLSETVQKLIEERYQQQEDNATR